MFFSDGRGHLEGVMMQVYTPQIASATRTFSGKNDDFAIVGALVLPMFNRANRYAMHLYVNRRLVRYRLTECNN